MRVPRPVLALSTTVLIVSGALAVASHAQATSLTCPDPTAPRGSQPSFDDGFTTFEEFTITEPTYALSD